MATVRVLTARDLRRAVLARQLLLARAKLSIPTALERVAGLQAQYAPAMYVGLWSRLVGFERADLTRALERRAVVQGTLMRSTIHLVSASDYWPFAIAVRASRRRWWMQSRKVTDREMRVATAKVHRAFGAEGVLRAADIDRIAGAGAKEGLNLWLDMVRVPPSGTWERRRADLYALAADWIGDPPLCDEVDARAHLVRRYLQGFGPASLGEIAKWSGLTIDDVEASVERIAPRSFAAEDGTPLVDLPRQPLPSPDLAAPVRFLPVWEALLLAHARRALLVREDDRARIFHHQNPQSLQTFLVDGQVAGSWRVVGDHVELESFRPLGSRVRRMVDAEAALLHAFSTA